MIDELLNEIKRIHFIGIGGSGMCPLAEILHSKGYILTGSDNNESDTLNRIKNLGIKVYMGHSADNIQDAQMIIYTAAIMQDNPELNAAIEMRIPTFERSKLFGAISRKYGNTIGISGTHGKTTTTAMIVHTLLSAGLDPSCVIGGKLTDINANGRVGSGDLFVCEACEFKDTFLDLSPRCAVILNIDEDHLDYFKTFDNLRHSFTKFANLAQTVIFNYDDEDVHLALQNVKVKELISFGFNDGADYQVKNLAYHHGAFPEFDIYFNKEFLLHLTLNVTGKHNALNAAAAVATCVYAGADINEIKKGIESFKGAGRRFETLYDKNGIRIADDYAHHPAELEVTIDAAMALGYKRFWAVFQPFTYSRTALLFDDFVRVLSKADRCVMTEIMGSREVNTYNIYTSQLAEKIPNSVWFNTFEEVADYLYKNVEKGDFVMTMGCGDVYKIAKLLIKKYESE
ncbi:MAG TPA: UDP-N-acetylmuramate--L-alanine ligase [Clostridiales bacterium]|nr:UDP-N-acetylmuramate--L-alanine ligase [Clostridiales bacterium]